MRRLALVLFAACATTPAPAPQGGPRGMRASDHLAAARTHDDIAHQTAWPDMRPDVSGYPPSTAGLVWYRSWDSTAENERLARYHRHAAGELQADYEAACGSRSEPEVSFSPLARYAMGGWPTATGVIMYLTPEAGSADKLLADINCHRAWMMLAPAGMDDCPLDLPGLVLDARGDANGVTVSLSVRDPKLLDELRRRAAHDVETASRRAAPRAPQ